MVLAIGSGVGAGIAGDTGHPPLQVVEGAVDSVHVGRSVHSLGTGANSLLLSLSLYKLVDVIFGGGTGQCRQRQEGWDILPLVDEGMVDQLLQSGPLSRVQFENVGDHILHIV